MVLAKSPTGIAGFDEITGGGLPTGRISLIEGGPGSGKSVFALQALVHGVRERGEPGIFVAFEESVAQIQANAATFGWGVAGIPADRLFFLDAQPDTDLVQSGRFDIAGLLAALGAQAEAMGARRIVFDAIDIVLQLMGDEAAARVELMRLQQWLAERELTAVITGKRLPGPHASGCAGGFHERLQFLVDCVVHLNHELVQGVSQRTLAVRKYRGSGFLENEAPLLIGATGIEIGVGAGAAAGVAPAPTERVSTGVARLDTMLDGGYLRGASILITGAPGTAKTSLCAAFAMANHERNEKTLYVSFDSLAGEIERDMRSIGLRLEEARKAGTLQLLSARADSVSGEIHLTRIKQAALEFGATFLIVDPVSALLDAGEGATAYGVAERLNHWAKREGITLLCTSLPDRTSPLRESSPTQVSTIADAWIHLSYLVQGGERNRGLSIIKARGTRHSNQVRELVLSNHGISLSDVFTAGGEVLMGTLRWEREQAVRHERERQEAEEMRRRTQLEAEMAELQGQLRALQKQIALREAESAALARAAEREQWEEDQAAETLRRLRHGDSMVSGEEMEGR